VLEFDEYISYGLSRSLPFSLKSEAVDSVQIDLDYVVILVLLLNEGVLNLQGLLID